MDPPLVSESSFSAANPAAYSLDELWPFGGSEPGTGSLGLRMGNLGPNPNGFAESSGNRDGSAEESTVTEQSGGGGGGRKKRKEVSSEDESSKMVSTSSANDLLVRLSHSFFLIFCFVMLCYVIFVWFLRKRRKVKAKIWEKWKIFQSLLVGLSLIEYWVLSKKASFWGFWFLFLCVWYLGIEGNGEKIKLCWMVLVLD